VGYCVAQQQVEAERLENDIMTEGEVWRVTGLLCGDPFEVKFTSWDSYDPEAKARAFYDGQTCLINTSLTVQVITRTWEKPVQSKDGPETRESGGPCLPDEAA